jgi:dephospho-CoA kinase
MTDHEHPVKILAFVGLAGSGKTSAVEYLTAKGYPKVYFGGIIYAAMREAGLEPGSDWEREANFREEIREREGKDYVVKRAIKEVYGLIEAGQHRIILDGLYTWTEYKALRHEFPGEMTVVAIVTPKHLRKQRMAKRPERPMTAAEVDERDWDEIENLEKGGPIAIADHFIHNEGDIEKLHQQVDTLLDDLQFT